MTLQLTRDNEAPQVRLRAPISGSINEFLFAAPLLDSGQPTDLFEVIEPSCITRDLGYGAIVSAGLAETGHMVISTIRKRPDTLTALMAAPAWKRLGLITAMQIIEGVYLYDKVTPNTPDVKAFRIVLPNQKAWEMAKALAVAYDVGHCLVTRGIEGFRNPATALK